MDTDLVLVVDASGVVPACLVARGFDFFGDEELVAPGLMWSEASSAIHEMQWRREISERLGLFALEALLVAPVARRSPRALRRDAWRLADRLGWAKTYDAEYVALALALRCRLFSLDGRLRRGAGHVVEIIGPDDLEGE